MKRNLALGAASASVSALEEELRHNGAATCGCRPKQPVSCGDTLSSLLVNPHGV